MVIKKKIKKIARITITVVTAVLLVVGIIIVYNFYKLSSELLYNGQYTSFVPAEADMATPAFSPIEKAFREKKYKTVLELKKKSARITANEYFFCGLSYLELDDPFNAIHSLQAAIGNDKMPGLQMYKEDAEFYLALAYLKNRDYDQALELMKAIHNNRLHPYHKKFSERFIRKVKILKWR